MRQGQAREDLTDMAKLGRGSAQELAANRSVEEQVPNLDARTWRAIPGFRDRQLPAMTGNLTAAWQLRRPRLERDLGNAADGRQRLAAEAERADAKEIVGLAQFARGVTGEGES